MNRPVILLGNGMRGNSLVAGLLSLDIPVLATWMAADMIAEDHPAFCGRPGILGQRAANIIQQKATHLYCFGARLDGEQVFYDYDKFAPNAEIFVWDADDAEFLKFPERYKRFTTNVDLVVPEKGWRQWCKALYNTFRSELEGTPSHGKFVDPFDFMRLLSDACQPTDVLAIGSSGNAPTTFLQTFKVKAGQRISNASTIGAMGADIPMALGAALATGRRTICVTGDGGFQLNVQELETVSRLHLPIIFFVLNNNGYASIAINQDVRFGRRVGSDPASGLTLPQLEDVAHAYGMMYMKLDGDNVKDFDRCFVASPIVIEVMVDPAWVQRPRVMAEMVDGEFIKDDMADMTPKIRLTEFMK